ncbi:hypothetical protein BN1211_0176 [Cyberlindnera jadinii]|uniref:Uncharacterized protein n=1 Tax=Cyberlindnera jadinii (strain ATCC 18201 / CBS 1600 / BCRC 20928 / JCM 3617 / NBRC 0987 / NRRL Y-1542) TaxID=983966 RepID=A0A0H5CAB3_CYBJN|nr:hypothetical protein BN1211_0176 [Cyberlindnera jadinii]
MGSGSAESADKIEENRATGACLDILSPPKPSSTSTPPTATAGAIGGSGNETSDSFNPFEKDSLDESASVLSSKQLLAEGQGSNALPSELVDINLAISALNLDFDGQKRGQTTATTEPVGVLKDGAEPSATGSDDHPPPALYPPGMIPQHMPFFPLNEFGQPMHAPFPGDHPHSPIPWDSKPGQTPFGLMGSQSPNMDGLRSQMVPPGMVPMVPPGNFDFHGDGLSGGPPITDPSQLFGMKGLKDGQLSANFPGMEHMGFNAPQQHMKNNPMWSPINGRDEQQFNGVQLPPNGLVHNNMHHDRRYPYYQPRNNHRHNNNGFNNRNHPNRKPNRYREPKAKAGVGSFLSSDLEPKAKTGGEVFFSSGLTPKVDEVVGGILSSVFVPKLKSVVPFFSSALLVNEKVDASFWPSGLTLPNNVASFFSSGLETPNEKPAVASLFLSVLVSPDGTAEEARILAPKLNEGVSSDFEPPKLKDGTLDSFSLLNNDGCSGLEVESLETPKLKEGFDVSLMETGFEDDVVSVLLSKALKDNVGSLTASSFPSSDGFFASLPKLMDFTT